MFLFLAAEWRSMNEERLSNHRRRSHNEKHLFNKDPNSSCQVPLAANPFFPYSKDHFCSPHMLYPQLSTEGWAKETRGGVKGQSSNGHIQPSLLHKMDS